MPQSELLDAVLLMTLLLLLGVPMKIPCWILPDAVLLINVLLLLEE